MNSPNTFSFNLLPEVRLFFESVLMHSNEGDDTALLSSYAQGLSAQTRDRLEAELRKLIAEPSFSLEALGSEANRWFEDEAQARVWLKALLDCLPRTDEDQLEVKDSNGNALAEGDSVLVTKDLKVKGGSSDLKRGTLIQNIHLVDDPDVVECRVGGSTLVLKTIFLKKA